MSHRPTSDAHEDAGGLEPVGVSIEHGISPSHEENEEMKSKRGFALAPETDARLDAMAFALGETRSAIVDRAVRGELDRLAPDERHAVDVALRVAARGEGGRSA